MVLTPEKLQALAKKLGDVVPDSSVLSCYTEDRGTILEAAAILSALADAQPVEQVLVDFGDKRLLVTPALDYYILPLK